MLRCRLRRRLDGSDPADPSKTASMPRSSDTKRARRVVHRPSGYSPAGASADHDRCMSRSSICRASVAEAKAVDADGDDAVDARCGIVLTTQRAFASNTRKLARVHVRDAACSSSGQLV